MCEFYFMKRFSIIFFFVLLISIVINQNRYFVCFILVIDSFPQVNSKQSSWSNIQRECFIIIFFD